MTFPKKPVWMKKKKAVPGTRRKLEDMDFWSLVNVLDDEVSYYVRTTAAINEGMGGHVRCYTCGSVHHWKDMDCGHMIRRENMGTRFDVEILRCQCTECNRYHGGKQREFRERLVEELGEETVKQKEDYAEFYGMVHPDNLLLIEKIKCFRAINSKRKKEEPWKT